MTDLSGPAAVIAECDENLCGTNLSAAERALFTARRKEAYEALHPETKAHVAGAHGANRVMGNASANLAPAFTADTARRTGQSERKVQRADLTVMERAEHIAEWVRLTEAKSKAQVAPSGHTGGRPDKGINAAVRDLHIDRTEAQRAVAYCLGLPPALARLCRSAHSRTSLGTQRGVSHAATGRGSFSGDADSLL